MTRGKRIYFASFFLLSSALYAALPPSIGIASAVGSFVVNSARVDGNANLFEGTQIRTAKASSQLFLSGGASLVLGIDSSGTVYRDRFVLQDGAAKVDNMTGYGLNAREFRIRESQPASQAVVRIEEDTVEVAALTGGLNVFNRQGALLTRIGSGTATAFQSGSGGTSSGGYHPPESNNNNRLKIKAASSLLLAGTLAGLGLAVYAITQPAPTSQ